MLYVSSSLEPCSHDWLSLAHRFHNVPEALFWPALSTVTGSRCSFSNGPGSHFTRNETSGIAMTIFLANRLLAYANQRTLSRETSPGDG